MTSPPKRLGMRPAKRLGWAIVGLGLALFAALALVLVDQQMISSTQHQIKRNERQIAVLQLKLAQLEQAAAAGRIESKQQQQLVQALQQQVRRLGGTPVVLPPTQSTGGADESRQTPSPSRTSKPQPSPTRTPRPRPSPSQRPSSTPSPSPSICLPVLPCLPPRVLFLEWIM